MATKINVVSNSGAGGNGYTNASGSMIAVEGTFASYLPSGVYQDYVFLNGKMQYPLFLHCKVSEASGSWAWPTNSYDVQFNHKKASTSVLK